MKQTLEQRFVAEAEEISETQAEIYAKAAASLHNKLYSEQTVPFLHSWRDSKERITGKTITNEKYFDYEQSEHLCPAIPTVFGKAKNRQAVHLEMD